MKQVPICVPSAEQTDAPPIVHAVVESVGADEGDGAGIEEEDGAAGTTTSRAGATEGAAAGGDELGLSEGTAAGAADDDGSSTNGDALDGAVVLSLSPEPPGTVQPMGVHSIP